MNWRLRAVARAPGSSVASRPNSAAFMHGRWSARAGTSRRRAGWCALSQRRESPHRPAPPAHLRRHSRRHRALDYDVFRVARLRFARAQARGARSRDLVGAARDDVAASERSCESGAALDPRRTRRPGRSRSGRLRAIFRGSSGGTSPRPAGRRSMHPRVGSLGAGALRVEPYQLVGRFFSCSLRGMGIHLHILMEAANLERYPAFRRDRDAALRRDSRMGAWRIFMTRIALCGPIGPLDLSQGQRRPASGAPWRLERGAAHSPYGTRGRSASAGRVPLSVHERTAPEAIALAACRGCTMATMTDGC
jgi:hypothetical protein